MNPDYTTLFEVSKDQLLCKTQDKKTECLVASALEAMDTTRDIKRFLLRNKNIPVYVLRNLIWFEMNRSTVDNNKALEPRKEVIRVLTGRLNMAQRDLILKVYDTCQTQNLKSKQS